MIRWLRRLFSKAGTPKRVEPTIKPPQPAERRAIRATRDEVTALDALAITQPAMAPPSRKREGARSTQRGPTKQRRDLPKRPTRAGARRRTSHGT